MSHMDTEGWVRLTIPEFEYVDLFIYADLHTLQPTEMVDVPIETYLSVSGQYYSQTLMQLHIIRWTVI
jgi:hypothetical protein